MRKAIPKMKQCVTALCLSFVAVIGSPVLAQERKSSQIPDWEIESFMLDSVFPRGPFTVGENEERSPKHQLIEPARYLTLRFTPAFHPEFQISIRKDEHRRLDIIYYTIPKQAGSYLPEGSSVLTREQIESIAKTIPVRKEVIRTSGPKLTRLIDGFTALNIPELDTGVILDGVKYEIWYETFQSQVHFSLSDVYMSAKSRYHHSTVRWMVDVLRAVKPQSAELLKRTRK